ncbi:hypothetical protein WN944_001613 [Citrus x changshan-huyou]|uniref:Uncharacterized protein n=1 Tax=Citrus x changshan-huyou TaxID=2935761 RepID=A0AAP0MF02_9ROSI
MRKDDYSFKEEGKVQLLPLRGFKDDGVVLIEEEVGLVIGSQVKRRGLRISPYEKPSEVLQGTENISLQKVWGTTCTR